MKRRAAIVLLLTLAFAGAPRAETGDGMEGTVWKYRPKGIISWFCFWNRDYLVFQSGNFMKADLKDVDFLPALYTATKTGEGVKWSATLTSARAIEMRWEGLRVSYWMTGTVKQGDSSWRWKAWQIFPKPPKEEAPPAPKSESPASPEKPATDVKQEPLSRPAPIPTPAAVPNPQNLQKK